MFLTGAEALGMTHRQCLDLLESAEDTLDFLGPSSFRVETNGDNRWWS